MEMLWDQKDVGNVDPRLRKTSGKTQSPEAVKERAAGGRQEEERRARTVLGPGRPTCKQQPGEGVE